jgi:hypothetical protein
MRVVVVDPPKLPPTHGTVAGWNMVGFNSTVANVPTEDYPGGMEYFRICGFKNGTRSLIPGPAYNYHKMEPGLGYWTAFTEPGIIHL